MSAASGIFTRNDEDHGPESRPTRAYSTAMQCALVSAIGPRPDAYAHYKSARSLADRLEGDALRYAKVLPLLDLNRARGCAAVASSARDAAARFRAWIKFDPPLPQRQADLALWSIVLKKAGDLGVDVATDLAA